jgi:hypothetical protein
MTPSPRMGILLLLEGTWWTFMMSSITC